MIKIDIQNTAEVSVDGKRLFFPDKKPRVILAMLVIEPGHRLSRQWLETHLWSDREKSQAAASLRQALSVIRKRLGDEASAINADREFVSIDPTRIQASKGHKEKILDGLDIQDAAFRHWLKCKRINQAKPLVETALYQSTSPVESTSDVSIFRIGLLPTLNKSDAHISSTAGEYTLEKLAQGITQSGIAGVVDYRQVFAGYTHSLTGNKLHKVDLFLQLSVLDCGMNLLLCCRVFDALNNTQLWSGTCEVRSNSSLFESLDLQVFLNQIMDFIHFVIGSEKFLSHSEQRDASSLALTAISEILKARDGDLFAADKMLQRAYEIEKNSIYLAWRTQIYAYLIGERLVDNDQTYREQLAEVVVKTTEVGRFNPVSLSLAAHAYSFIFKDYHKAQELFKMVMAQRPMQAICYDMAATTNVYVGNKKQAYQQAQHALALGQYSPFRYCIETTCAMASAINKKYDEASYFSDRVCEKKPTFTAALRYGVVAKSLGGKKAESIELYKTFKDIEPDFSIALLKSKQYPVCGTDETRDMLEMGFKSMDI